MMICKSLFVELISNKQEAQYPIGHYIDHNIEKAKSVLKDSDLIKYIDISSINKFNKTIAKVNEYVFKDAPSRAQQITIKGDILVSTVRPNLKNIAKNNLNYKNMVASSGFCIIRCLESKCTPEYILSILDSDAFTNKINSLAKGANYPAVSSKDILSYQIPDISVTDQRKYSNEIKKIDKLKF